MKHLVKRPSFCGAFNNSGSPIKDFVERHNIANYRDRLKMETDPFRRAILHDLLAEEEAKQASHVNIPSRDNFLGIALPTAKGRQATAIGDALTGDTNPT
jgi:hypothetical protein